MKKTFEIPKIRIAHISKFLGGGAISRGFEGQKYKIFSFYSNFCCFSQLYLFLPLGLKAQRGIAIMVSGVGRSVGRRSVVGVRDVSCLALFRSIF